MRLIRFERMMPLLGALLLAGPVAANQTPRTGTTLEERVEAAICSSPRYGPFDLISFQVTGDTVTLGGNVYQATLRKEAERKVAAVTGVSRVVNSIEILPPSFEDDRLRRAVFVTIYRDPRLSKYGTPLAALTLGHGRASRSLRSNLAFGLEPLGNYAIHVVVKGGRVTLYGRVDNVADRDKATMDARMVFGVMGVENRIEVTRQAPAV